MEMDFTGAVAPAEGVRNRTTDEMLVSDRGILMGCGGKML